MPNYKSYLPEIEERILSGELRGHTFEKVCQLYRKHYGLVQAKQGEEMCPKRHYRLEKAVFFTFWPLAPFPKLDDRMDGMDGIIHQTTPAAAGQGAAGEDRGGSGSSGLEASRKHSLDPSSNVSSKRFRTATYHSSLPAKYMWHLRTRYRRAIIQGRTIDPIFREVELDQRDIYSGDDDRDYRSEAEKKGWPIFVWEPLVQELAFSEIQEKAFFDPDDVGIPEDQTEEYMNFCRKDWEYQPYKERIWAAEGTVCGVVESFPNLRFEDNYLLTPNGGRNGFNGW